MDGELEGIPAELHKSMTNEAAAQMVQAAADRLAEHFPAVQILVSWPSDNLSTKSVKKGCGDWYARQGLAHEFINEDQAIENARAIASELKEPPEDWQAQTK